MKKIQKNAARFDNLKQDFLDDKKYSGTAEATLNGYRYDITRFLKFLSDEQLAVNEAGFKRYVVHLTDSGMTANSVNQYIRSVKVFFYWCMEQDEIKSLNILCVSFFIRVHHFCRKSNIYFYMAHFQKKVSFFFCRNREEVFHMNTPIQLKIRGHTK